MALSDTIKSAVATAFSTIGDLKTTVTYRHIIEATYNTESGDVGAVRPPVRVEGVLSSVNLGLGGNVSEMKEPIGEPPLRFFLMQQASIDFTPNKQDQVILDSGEVYSVLIPEMDAARVTWKLPLRRLP